MNNRRVVITGMGIWSCIGTSKDEVLESLRIGRSGIGREDIRLGYGYQSDLTGIVPDPDLKPLLHRRLRTGMSQEAEYSYMAAREAFAQALVDEKFLAEREVGIIFGNDSSAKPVIEAEKLMSEKRDSALLGSGLIFQSMNSTVNMNLSSIFGLRGINFTVSAACASGSHSVGLGFLMIKQGLQDVVLCGGAQEVNHFSMFTFDALGAFSKRMSEPERASRPFDRDRDGLIPSGGAAALVLEEYESAIRRGAPILAEVTGYGFSSNGGGISQPSDDGSVIAYNDQGLVQKIIDKHLSTPGISDRLNGRKLYYQLYTSGFKDIHMMNYVKDLSGKDFDERHDIFEERFSYRKNYIKNLLKKDPTSISLKNDLEWMEYALNKLEELFGNESFWYQEVDFVAVGRK